MTRRAWILVLEAGLCGSLSACATPVRTGADELVAHSAESDMTSDILDQPSPYTVVPQREKPASPKSLVLPEALVSRSPYASFPRQIPSPTPDAPASKSLSSEPPPPEPPPPEPPTPMVEPPSASVNMTNLKQVPPLPLEAPPSTALAVSESAHQEVSTVVNNPNSSSPYAEIKREAPKTTPPVWPGLPSMAEPTSPYAAIMHGSPVAMPAKTRMMTWDNSPPSPYTTISTQPITTSASKVPQQESISPYAPTRTEGPPPKKETGLDSPDISGPAKPEAEGQVQPAKFPEQPEMHVIQGSAPSPPQADLDVITDSSSLDRPIVRKGDEPPLLTAMRCFLNKHPAEALTWLKRYDEPNQELLIRLMPLINQLAVRDLTRSEAEKVIEMMGDLYNLAGIPGDGDLVIGKLCLCKRIKAFGDYEPFPEDHPFQPRDLVWIYAEVRNFTSERRDPGNGELVFETRLKTTARITNSAGNHEWSLDFDRRYGPDRSRTLRHDYWDNLSFNVPPDLPPGIYTLWLKVVDEPTGRFKERAVDFQVVPLKGS